MMRLLFILAMVIVGYYGQSQAISGQVFGETVDGKQEALAGATVFWKDTRMGTATDIDGKFTIAHPPSTSHQLITSYVGYITDTIEYAEQSSIKIVLRNNSQTSTVNVHGGSSGTYMSTLNPMLFQTIDEKELCKAACCNLSESFETNASIDAAFADAVTGTRQIRMLGLEGRYTQMMFDNVPAVRGLASTYGLTYVPGPWIKNIYIAKGVGSVTAGFESITGQINVAMKNPDNAEKLHVNGYLGNNGRMELNLVMRPKQLFWPTSKERNLETVFLAHGAISQLRSDMNGDGFLDNPLFSNIILRNEWHLETKSGWGSQLMVSYLKMKNTSGKFDYDPRDELRSTLWGVNTETERYEFSAKTGYVYKEKPWKSFGSQVSMSWHDQKGVYGFRDYQGQQLSGRVNLLFASRIKSDAHKFTTGISYQYDNYLERLYFNQIPPIQLASLNLNRMESVPGVFGEYTMNTSPKFTIIAGLRGDYHNVYGTLVTPRLHARYSLAETTSVKFVGGKGYRTANIIMDNVGILASNRDILLQGNTANGIQGLKMEEAWNVGLIFTHKFKFNYREGTLSIDAYRTDFMNQVVVDMEQAKEVRFYNLEGKSYSNSAQAELHYSPIRRLDVRLAYRWLEVRQQYTSGMLDKPLVNRHRAFTNLAYETKGNTKGAQWRFDATLQWISKKRLPLTDEHASHSDMTVYSEDFFQLNAQATYVVKKNVEIYLGGENLTNFMVHHVIVSAENPSADSFDGSLLWGPVFGRMAYIGFRWIIE